MPDDPCKDVKYKESAIDSMRAQKDEVHLKDIFTFCHLTYEVYQYAIYRYWLLLRYLDVRKQINKQINTLVVYFNTALTVKCNVTPYCKRSILKELK